MPVPLAPSVEPGVDRVARANQVVRQSRSANAAKDQPTFAESAINRFAPPAFVPELDRVSVLRIELTANACQTRRRVAIARRELKEKTAKLFAENLLDGAKFFDEHARSEQVL